METGADPEDVVTVCRDRIATASMEEQGAVSLSACNQ